MEYQRILYEKATVDIVKILMNRPEVRNAQDFQMFEELMDAFDRADMDEDIRVIIFGGVGADFSSGHDMSGRGLPGQGTPLQTKRTGLEGRLKREQYIFYEQGLRQRNVSKPTIAMVQGHCIAGAFLNACMCDIIIASDDAIFQNPVLRMTPSGAEILVEPWEMGARKAKEFLWTGDSLDAQEAYRLGIVNRVVPRDRLEDETVRLARKIALTPPITVMLTKRSINRTLDMMGQANAWDYHFLIHQMAHSTDEAQNFFKEMWEAREKGGLKAFLEMRDAKYREND